MSNLNNIDGKVFQHLQEVLDDTIEHVRSNNQIILKIINKDGFIKLLEQLPPNEILQIASNLFNIMKLFGSLNESIEIIGPKSIIKEINFLDLLQYKILENQEEPTIRLPSKFKADYDSGILALCYTIFLTLVLHRLYLYLSQNPTARDALYVRHAEILKHDSNSQPYLLEALTNLTEYTKNTYQKKRKVREDSHTIDLERVVWQAIVEVLPPSIKEGLTMVLKGDANVNYIPHRAANKLITFIKKELINAREMSLSLDEKMPNESNLTRMDFLEDPSDIEELLETLDTERIVSQVIKLIENTELFTDRERQVVNMRYREDEIYSLEQIGGELGITRQTVHEIEKNALKKLLRHLKQFNFN